ncbi:MAG: electron transport complex subunit RsxA [Clostridia bacterium]|nr:electron transport complex subunit RsxA [Clostridia bacterium]
MSDFSLAEIFIFAINAILVENLCLVKFLGICPFLGVSKKPDTAVGMGIAVTFIMTLSSFITWLIYHLILVPAKLEYLDTLSFILVIAALVQFVEMVLKKLLPSLYSSLGIYLPLITTNCAVLGIALTNITEQHNLLMSVLNGMFCALGFTLAIWLFACVRERVEHCEIPKPFQGTPIALITAALLSFAFMGFSGIEF